jgi:hypothetical protein
MPVQEPYTAFGFSTLSEETVSTRLSFALNILDEDTGKPPAVPVKVMIEGRDTIIPRKNLSGYFLFVDLPDGTYTVSVDADSYSQKKEDVKIPRPAPDEKNPLFEIKIKRKLKT